MGNKLVTTEEKCDQKSDINGFRDEDGVRCSNALHTFRFHQLEHANAHPYKCRYIDEEDDRGCELMFKTDEEFKNHMEVHKAKDEFKATHPCICSCIIDEYGDECSDRFKSEDDLRHHIKTQLLANVFPCYCIIDADGTECSEEFTSCDELRVHQRIHSDVTLYKCEYSNCHSEFKTREQLTTHAQVHVAPRAITHTCRNCGNVYRLSQLLTTTGLLEFHKQGKCIQ